MRIYHLVIIAKKKHQNVNKTVQGQCATAWFSSCHSYGGFFFQYKVHFDMFFFYKTKRIYMFRLFRIFVTFKNIHNVLNEIQNEMNSGLMCQKLDYLFKFKR